MHIKCGGENLLGNSFHIVYFGVWGKTAQRNTDILRKFGVVKVKTRIISIIIRKQLVASAARPWKLLCAVTPFSVPGQGWAAYLALNWLLKASYNNMYVIIS